MTKQEYLEITNQLIEEEKEVREKTEKLLKLKEELEKNIKGLTRKRSLLVQYSKDFDKVATNEEQKRVSEAFLELERLDIESRKHLEKGVILCNVYWE